MATVSFYHHGGTVTVGSMPDLDAMGILDAWTEAITEGPNGVITLTLDDSSATHLQMAHISRIDIYEEEEGAADEV